MNDTETTRAEHLAWCKKRALEYCDIGDVNQAFASMGSDLENDERTAGHAGLKIGIMLMMNGSLNSPDEMRKFINGFN